MDRDTAEDPASRLLRKPICRWPTAAKLEITEQSENVYENKGSMLEENFFHAKSVR